MRKCIAAILLFTCAIMNAWLGMYEHEEIDIKKMNFILSFLHAFAAVVVLIFV